MESYLNTTGQALQDRSCHYSIYQVNRSNSRHYGSIEGALIMIYKSKKTSKKHMLDCVLE